MSRNVVFLPIANLLSFRPTMLMKTFKNVIVLSLRIFGMVFLRSRNEESSNWMEGEIALHSLSVSSDKARIGSWWPHVTILQRLDLNTKVLAASLQSEEEKDLQPNDIILTTFRYGIVYLRPRHDWYFSCGAMTLFWFRAAHLHKAYQMLAQCCGTIYHIHRTANWFLQKSRTFPSSIGLIDLP